MKTIRRLYFYLAAFISLEVVVWALISLLRSFFDRNLSDVLAGGLAFILVGLPVFLVHWRVVQREAQAEPEERFSGVRAVFLYGAWIGLAVPVVHALLSIVLRALALALNTNTRLIAFGGYQNWSDNIIAILVNGVLAAYFFSVLKKDWEANPPDEAFPFVRGLNRYSWVLYGLGLSFAGTVQIIQFILDRILQAGFRSNANLVNALGLVLIGVPLWLYSWGIAQKAGKISQVRTVTLYVLSLIAALASLLSAGNFLLTIFRTFMSASRTWTHAWGDLGIGLSILLPSIEVWAYHWYVLKHDIGKYPSSVTQHSQRRLYFYLLSLLGLGATFIALQMLVSIFVEAFFCSPSDNFSINTCKSLTEIQLPNALAILLVSVPVWVLHWRPAQLRALRDDEVGESARGSLLRRAYLYLVLFAGVIGSMVTTGWLLYEVIENLLGVASSFSAQTIFTSLGTLILFVIFTVYHWRLLREDGRKLDQTMADRHKEFPVMVLAKEETFLEEVRQALAVQAPGIPLIEQNADKALGKGAANAKAVILQADTLIGAKSALKDWLDAFTGQRLIIPSAAAGWIWLGLTEQSPERQIRQAVKVIQQLAEAGETKAARSLSPGAVVGYVFGVLFGLFAICALTSALIELFN